MKNAVHGNTDYMTELTGGVISVVKLIFVQNCASTFDLQRDPKVVIFKIMLPLSCRIIVILT